MEAELESMSQDEVEAKSHQHAWGIKIIPLSSGRWGVFGRDRFEVLEILDQDYLRAWANRDEASYRKSWAESSPRWGERLEVGVEKSLEDLGL